MNTSKYLKLKAKVMKEEEKRNKANELEREINKLYSKFGLRVPNQWVNVKTTIHQTGFVFDVEGRSPIGEIDDTIELSEEDTKLLSEAMEILIRKKQEELKKTLAKIKD